jgi:DNA-binding GntR family transcriptional regulator
MNKNVNLKLEDRDTLHLKVCNVLRKAILQGDFEPGERLIQEELASALGVSRMPVREALRKLETEGLIELVPHRGAIVKPLHVEDVEEIYTLRAKLEKLAVSKSVGKTNQEDIQKLEYLVDEMKEADEAEEFVNANIEYHRMLMKHCPWNRLLSFIETLWNGFPQQTPHMLPGQVDLSNQEHDKILQAVKDGDADKAANLVSNHIQRTGKSLIESIRKSKGEHRSLLQKIGDQ